MRGEPAPTILDLISALNEVTSDEAEVLATALHMIRSGRVRLHCGAQAAPARR